MTTLKLPPALDDVVDGRHDGDSDGHPLQAGQKVVEKSYAGGFEVRRQEGRQYQRRLYHHAELSGESGDDTDPAGGDQQRDRAGRKDHIFGINRYHHGDWDRIPRPRDAFKTQEHQAGRDEQLVGDGVEHRP